MEEIIKPSTGWEGGEDGETHSREKESLASIQLALGGGGGRDVGAGKGASYSQRLAF